MSDNVILEKSKAFALRIVKLENYLRAEHREYAIANQVLKSGTSIGANVRESVRAQSKADFYSKLNIALKEAEETLYWLEILHESGYLDQKMFASIYGDGQEVLKLLVSITKTQKQ